MKMRFAEMEERLKKVTSQRENETLRCRDKGLGRGMVLNCEGWNREESQGEGSLALGDEKESKKCKVIYATSSINTRR